jgi:hypothetical protein
MVVDAPENRYTARRGPSRKAIGSAPVQGTRSAIVVLPPRLKETVALPATGFTDFDASPKK